MEFKILSHACMVVKTKEGSVIIDPWLLGSCYWRSWWNFPEPQFDRDTIEKVDAVIISHSHWDHWHGPTLKKYFREKPIYISDEFNARSKIDLHSIGFKNVKTIPHGRNVKIANLKIHFYQFGGLFWTNDTALVIEAEGKKLLNANDSKIAGPSLGKILSLHGKFDFAFRSHSSANPRACFEIKGQPAFSNDDRDHYFRSFCAFMDAVKPKYAIPFASNHCHLHEDSYHFNDYIANPVELRKFAMENKKKKREWKLVVMLPGSSWDTETQFKLSPEDVFLDLKTTIDRYREKNKDKLEANRVRENLVKIDKTLLNRFLNILNPIKLPKKCTGEILLTLIWADGRGASWKIDLKSLEMKSTSVTKTSLPNVPNLVMPAIIFRDSVVKNMFGHAGISKRCRFLADSPSDLNKIVSFFEALESVERGTRPFNSKQFAKLLFHYMPRWRELLFYLNAAWLIKIRRIPNYLVEEKILMRQSNI